MGTWTLNVLAQEVSTIKVSKGNKWGAQVVSDNNLSASAISNLGSSSIGEGDKTVVSTNYAGPLYRLDEKTTLGFRQYWDHTFGKNIEKPDTQGWSVLTATKKVGSLLGSEEIVPQLWVYLPVNGNKDLESGIPDKNIRHNGTLRLDVEFDWQLSPRWMAGYFVSSRQSLVPGIENKYTASSPGVYEPSSSVQSKTTFVHYAVAYYSITEAIQPYAYLGMRNEFLTTESMYNSVNFGMPAIGANFNISKQFLLATEINQMVDLRQNTWFRSEELNYEVVLALTL
jgi:hypothetical protein